MKPKETRKQLLALEVGICPAGQGEGWAERLGFWEHRPGTNFMGKAWGRKIPEHVMVEKTATDRSSVEPGGTGGWASALGSAGTLPQHAEPAGSKA